jgi:DNA mismatch repair ATPase MutS
MSFITDKQTLDDLNILGKYKPQSMFSLFNRVQTTGGERLLDNMFRQPLADADEINRRSSIFRYFQEKRLKFPFHAPLFLEAENYLGTAAGTNLPVTMLSVLRKKMLQTVVRDEKFDQLQAGLLAAIELLNTFSELLEQLKDYPFPDQLAPVRKIFADQRLQWLPELRNKKQLSWRRVAQYHHLLQHVFQSEIEMVLQVAYHIDVYMAVSQVARLRSFTYAHALPQDANVFRAEALSHPGLEKAVANPVSFGQDKNLFFLTGANMAGKSTFMKAFGIAVYLAHMGFPVAAKEMQFSVRNGLYTSINVPDNLSMGYSHFYAEVLRVKHIAQEVSRGNNLVVIFDELFKGTNVKDAYDATLSVTEAFATYRNCFFIISTHIIEVGEALKPHGDQIHFRYMPTVMAGAIPQYTYLLTEGITNDRQGMMIIENEGIVGMLKGNK